MTQPVEEREALCSLDKCRIDCYEGETREGKVYGRTPRWMVIMQIGSAGPVTIRAGWTVAGVRKQSTLGTCGSYGQSRISRRHE